MQLPKYNSATFPTWCRFNGIEFHGGTVIKQISPERGYGLVAARSIGLPSTPEEAVQAEGSAKDVLDKEVVEVVGEKLGDVRVEEDSATGDGPLSKRATTSVPEDEFVEESGNVYQPKILLTVPKDLVLSQSLVEEHAKSDRHLREILEAVGDFGKVGRPPRDNDILSLNQSIRPYYWQMPHSSLLTLNSAWYTADTTSTTDLPNFNLTLPALTADSPVHNIDNSLSSDTNRCQAPSHSLYSFPPSCSSTSSTDLLHSKRT